MKVHLATDDKTEFEYLKVLFGSSGIELEKADIEITQIQSFDGKHITELSARDASYKVGAPTIKYGISWSIDGLNGFPGPYAQPLSKWLSTDEWIKLLRGIRTLTATAEETIAFSEPGKKPVTFTQTIGGTVLLSPKGKSTSVIETLFVPAGEKLTIAELKEKGKVWGANPASEQFVKFIKGNKPGQKSYEYTRKQVTVVIAIVQDGKKILLTKRNPDNFYASEMTVNFPSKQKKIHVTQPVWELPGGLIDFGETVENAAVREVKEETGLDVEPDFISQKILTQETLMKKNHTHCVLIPVWCRLKNKSTFNSNEEISEVKWVDISDTAETGKNPITEFFLKDRK